MSLMSRTAFSIGVALVCASASTAIAAPISLQFSSGATTITVNDGDPNDQDPADGAVKYVGSVGSWNLTVGTGLGPDVLGPATMSLSSVSLAAFGSADPLTVLLTQTDLMTAVTGFGLEFDGDVVHGGAVSYFAYADDANAAFGQSQLIGTLGPYGQGAFSGSTSGSVSVSGPYSLTQMLTMNGGGSVGPGSNTLYHGNAQLNPQLQDEHIERVPEPLSLTLFGSGLATVGVWLRRRRSARG
jgi:hypothetical protein